MVYTDGGACHSGAMGKCQVGLAVISLVAAGCACSETTTSATTAPVTGSSQVEVTTVATTLASSTTAADTTTTAVDTTTTAAAPTSTTELATTTTKASLSLVTTTLPGLETIPSTPDCFPYPSASPDAHETGTASADVDGDGADDKLITYWLGASPGVGDWHLRVELADGGGADIAFPFDPAPAAARVLGAHYLGSIAGSSLPDARAAIFVVTGAGASTSIVSLYRLDGCALVPFMLDSGDPASFPVGAGVMHASHVSCHVAGDMARMDWVGIEANADGTEFTITDTSYSRIGTIIKPIASSIRTEATMPEVPALINCDGVVSP